jgi:hypothetical protein
VAATGPLAAWHCATALRIAAINVAIKRSNNTPQQDASTKKLAIQASFFHEVLTRGQIVLTAF